MKKIISVFSTSQIKVVGLDEKTRLEQDLISFMKDNRISLWDKSKKKIDSQKIEEYNTLFKEKNQEVIQRLEELITRSAEFKNRFSTIVATNNQYNFMTLPEIYLLALKTMTTDFSGKKKIDSESWEIIYPRLLAARTDACFTFPVANKEASEKIFNLKTISLDEAEKLYGSKMKNPRTEFVIAGGDATRYLKALYSLEKALKLVSNSSQALDPIFLNQLINDPSNDDVKGLFCTKKLTAILETPIFHFSGVNSQSVSKDQNGNYNALEFKNALTKVLNNLGKDLAKVHTYAYEMTINNKKYFFNYFMNSYLQTLKKVMEEGTKGNFMYFMVKDAKNLHALEKVIDYLKQNDLFNPEILDVRFMDRTKDGLPVDVKTGQLVFDGNNLKTSSTGHGPALIKAANEVLTQSRKESVIFSVRTVDNSGSDLAEYTAIGQNGARIEFELKKQVTKILRDNDKDAFFKLLDNPKYGIKKVDYDSDKPLEDLVVKFVQDRWDPEFEKSDSVSLIKQLASKVMMTIAFVVSPRPEHKGGGLYVNKHSRRMAIVDKQQMTKEQEQSKDFSFYFNPMLYIVNVEEKLDGKIETNAIFVAKKGTIDAYFQGESASTHLATDPKYTLKRIVVVPKEKLENAFLQQKTIDETTVSANKDLTAKLTGIVESLAKEKGKSMAEIADILFTAQEQGRKHLVKTPNVVELAKVTQPRELALAAA